MTFVKDIKRMWNRLDGCAMDKISWRLAGCHRRKRYDNIIAIHFCRGNVSEWERFNAHSYAIIHRAVLGYSSSIEHVWLVCVGLSSVLGVWTRIDPNPFTRLFAQSSCAPHSLVMTRANRNIPLPWKQEIMLWLNRTAYWILMFSGITTFFSSPV